MGRYKIQEERKKQQQKNILHQRKLKKFNMLKRKLKQYTTKTTNNTDR